MLPSDPVMSTVHLLTPSVWAAEVIRVIVLVVTLPVGEKPEAVGVIEIGVGRVSTTMFGMTARVVLPPMFVALIT